MTQNIMHFTLENPIQITKEVEQDIITRLMTVPENTGDVSEEVLNFIEFIKNNKEKLSLLSSEDGKKISLVITQSDNNKISGSPMVSPTGCPSGCCVF